MKQVQRLADEHWCGSSTIIRDEGPIFHIHPVAAKYLSHHAQPFLEGEKRRDEEQKRHNSKLSWSALQSLLRNPTQW